MWVFFNIEHVQKKKKKKSAIFTSLSNTKFIFPIIVTDMPIKTCLMEINEKEKKSIVVPSKFLQNIY